MGDHIFINGRCVNCGKRCENIFQVECRPELPARENKLDFEKKLNDFSQGLVAINLSLADQVSQLRDELAQYKTDSGQLREIVQKIESVNGQWQAHVHKLQTRVLNQSNKITNLLSVNERLEAELKELREKTPTTMGVGSGGGKLFVHGDYESIKAAQAIVLENEKLRKENADLVASSKLNADLGNAYIINLEAQLREAKIISSSDKQRSNAWGEVHKVLTEVQPNWAKGADSGTNSACNTIRNMAAEIKKLKQINYDVNERAEKIWLLFKDKDNRIVSKCLAEISELLEKVSPGWTQAFKIEQDSSVYTVKKLIEDAQKFRSLTLITGHTVIGDQRYIRMRKVGKYFYQEYKPS